MPYQAAGHGVRPKLTPMSFRYPYSHPWGSQTYNESITISNASLADENTLFLLITPFASISRLILPMHLTGVSVYEHGNQVSNFYYVGGSNPCSIAEIDMNL